MIHLVFESNRSRRSGNSFANSSRTSFCIPFFHFRSSGIRVAKIPEFRYVQKPEIPEFGNSGIAITKRSVRPMAFFLLTDSLGGACETYSEALFDVGLGYRSDRSKCSNNHKVVSFACLISLWRLQQLPYVQ